MAVPNAETAARFDPVPESVRVARRFVGHRLRQLDVPDDPAETAVLLTSEIVGNAVRHAQSEIGVRVVTSPAVVRVEVQDTGPGEARVQVPEPFATGGRGLRIVASLATRWGTERVAGAKVVWFELALES